jgi:hypothetical protein
MDNNDFMKCVNDGEYSLIRNEYLKELEDYKNKHEKHDEYKVFAVNISLVTLMLLLFLGRLIGIL